MQNLFASNGQYRVSYLILWLLLGAIYSSVLVYTLNIGWVLALSDAFAFTLLIAIMAIAIMYIVKFSPLDSTSVLNTLTTHLVAAGILVFSLVTGIESLLLLIYPDQSQFYDLNSTNHIYRLVGSVIVYVFLATNFYLIFYYEEFRARKSREIKLDKHLKTAELNMLKAQINPHFIFNSLNSISSLTLTDPEKAHEMIIQLAEFLRYTIRENADQLVTLEKEIEAISSFLKIEKIRYGKRLNVEIKCKDGVKNLKLPVLIVQPLIENAIKYSLHETDLPSDISIDCQLKDEVLHLVVTNNYNTDFPISKGEGIGLNNVKERLKLVYGVGDFLLTSSSDKMFTAHLIIPQS